MAKFSRWIAWASKSCLVFGGFTSAISLAAEPSAKEALELKPVQPDVQFERPTKEQLEKCSIHKVAQEGVTGWQVRDGHGQTLRRFIDTNKDGKLDQWCYYRDGIEVYRDIDVNYNGKADQYRWLGTGGIRWGIDENEDGRIDRWKLISLEEVTAEVVAALRDKDADRFSRLLLSSEELKGLGLDLQRTQDIQKKLETAATGFKALADRQRIVTSKTEWVNSAAVQPGLFPAGTDGTTKDIIVYENVAAMIENGGKTSQLAIGTLVQVGNTWRLIDLPSVENQTAANHHFFLPIPGRNEVANAGEPMLTPEMQELVTRLEKVDTALTKAKPEDVATLNAEKADVLEKLIARASSKEDRTNFTRQLVDSVSAAIQGGEFTDGLDRLKSLLDQLETAGNDQDLTAYVTFRYLTAKYGLDVQDSKADVAKIQSQWIDSLEHFVTKYPNCADTAEAMMQLAIAQEFAGKTDDAVQWYGKIVRQFPDAPETKKAAGAKFRLESVGKTLSFTGRLTDGKTLDLAAYKGSVVLIHYWATWCEPCKQELATLKQVQAKYAGYPFRIIGVSLDNEPKALQSFLQANKLPWPQVYEAGGLESRPANELGIFTLPTMLLVDERGKVINRGLHAAELEGELSRRFKAPTGNAGSSTGKNAVNNANRAQGSKK